MEFRLIYRGALPSGDARGAPREKHRIRKEFHPQLRELWSQDPGLHAQSKQRFLRSDVDGTIYPAEYEGQPFAKTWLEWIADDHERCGTRFVPLVSNKGGFSCALDILFLRRDAPGGLLGSGGDLDNRLKVLFDALKMPGSNDELGGYSIDAANENPFFCLLEDDRLVSRVSVTTDRLIKPLEHNEKQDDVFLVIHVTVVNPLAIFAGGRLV